jgi:hypothetical protein
MAANAAERESRNLVPQILASLTGFEPEFSAAFFTGHPGHLPEICGTKDGTFLSEFHFAPGTQ